MKLARYKTRLSFLAWFLLAAIANSQAVGQSKPLPEATEPNDVPHATIPFAYDPVTRPFITIQARINGGEPQLFIVDTGLNEPILLDQEVARKLKLAPIKDSNRIGTDNVEFHKVQLGDITLLGSNKKEDVNMELASAFVADLGVAKQDGYAGVIGASVLAAMPVQFDFQAKTMTLFFKSLPPSRLQGATKLPVGEEDAKYSVTVLTAMGDSTSLMTASLLVDTGSQQTNIPLSIAAYMQPLARTITMYETANALHFTDMWLLPSLNFGPLVVPNVKVSLAGIPVLGLDVLSRFRITLDFPNGCLYLQRPGNLDQPARIGGWTGICLERRGKEWYIAGVEPNSPAANSDIKQGDLLLEIDGQAITSLTLHRVGILLPGLAGMPAKLTLQNKQGQSYQVSLIRKSEFDQPPSEMLGMLADKQAGGPMVISHILDGSPAQKQGLQPGDSITTINGRPMAKMSLEDVAIQFGLPRITLTVQRKGEDKPRLFHIGAPKS